MFKVIVAGGRDFNNYKGLAASLDYLLKNVIDDIEIVCGMARGADRLGEQYAKEHGYRIRYMPADLSAPFQNVIFRRNGMSLFAGWHTCVMQPYTPANLPA